MFDLDSWLFPSVIVIVFCPNLNFSQFYQKTGGVSREIPQDSSRSNFPSYFLVPISKMPFVFEFSFLFPRSYLGNAFCSRSNLKVTAYFCLAPIGEWEASRLFFRTFENILDSWSRLFHGRHFPSRSFRHIELLRARRALIFPPIIQLYYFIAWTFPALRSLFSVSIAYYRFIATFYPVLSYVLSR